jgi:hypothetical protein
VSIAIVPDTLVIASENKFSFAVPGPDLQLALALSGHPTPPEVVALEPTLANLLLRNPSITATHPRTGAVRVMFEHDTNPNSRVLIAKPRLKNPPPGAKRPPTRAELEIELKQLKKQEGTK